MGDMADVEAKLNNYQIIKEGEAEMLWPSSNAVFYNKAQVYNRDMSIAVLRTFIAKRKEEHAAKLNKKEKSGEKVPKAEPSGIAQDTAIIEDDKANGHSDMLLNNSPDGTGTDSVPEECVKTPSWKRLPELKAPRVLEALAASGLRSIRYAREVDGIGQVIAVDNDKASVEACKRNIKFNGSVACSKVEAHLADARIYMMTNPKEFDVVDLDPYGSPSVFLDSAVQSVADGGILMCTATDMAVLCGNNGEVCHSKYGSYPVKGKYCHEMALRILLACIESHANRYKRHIVPILSVYMDFYVRVFVRIFTSASAIKETPLKLSYVYQCVGCDSFHLQTLGRTINKDNSLKTAPGYGPVVPQECSDCGKKFNVGGPIWSAPIHEKEWVLTTLANVKAMKERYPAYDKICAVLTTVSEGSRPLGFLSLSITVFSLEETELDDIPLFVSLHNLCSTLKCTSPQAVIFRSAIINAGYHVSGSHVNPLAIKTDAPMDVIWDIMRCWVKNHPVKMQRPDMAGTVILSREPKLQANFARPVGSLSKAQVRKEKRWLPNPERHWGPKVRAGRQITSKHSSLLGSQVLNGSLGHEEPDGASEIVASDIEEHGPDEGAQPVTKRQKVGDGTSPQS